MAEIRFEKNGQGYYDFEYLLDLTSEEFMKEFQESLSVLQQNDQNVFVKIHDESNYFVQIFVANAYSAYFYEFSKKSKRFESSFIGRWQLDIISKMFAELKGDSDD